MRVVSMVPSWTETLLACGVDVVGRTRYCVHPHDLVQKIKIVGGTKELKKELIDELDPDFVLLDREENTKEMFEEVSTCSLVTHIERVEDVAGNLAKMAVAFKSDRLLEIADRWQKISDKEIKERSALEIPGVLKWLVRPEQIDHIYYIIWKNPWMSVSRETFIASQLTHLGLGEKIVDNVKKYYELENILPKSLMLFSSEPYPFLKRQEGLDSMGEAGAIVDGESYSWFGIRSLLFLEKYK